VNKNYLLLNGVFEGFQILLVKTYNAPGCQTSKCLNSRLDRALSLVVWLQCLRWAMWPAIPQAYVARRISSCCSLPVQLILWSAS